jgi:SAM-dependent methyltransferase
MSKPAAPARLDLLGLLEGHYASEIALGLIRSGALELLAAGNRVEVIARAVQADPQQLDLMLDFMARTSDLIERGGTGRYRLGNYSLAEIAFQLHKFTGAYADCVRGLQTPGIGRPVARVADDRALAAAFAAVGNAPSRLVERLRQQGCRRLVDLGCGPASLPIELAVADSDFSAIGLDRSAAMCRLARARAREAGVASRVTIKRADISEIRDALDAGERRRVDALHGRSVLNAFFGRGPNSARAMLRTLRLAFPGRVAFFVDYYGELGHAPASRRGFRLGQLQDLAQLASGQGIPPSRRRDWQALYRAAGCKLISADDSSNDNIRWFVHQVRLAP